MRRCVRALLAAVAGSTMVTGLGLPAVAPARAAEAYVNHVRLNGYETALADDINAARRAQGLPGLVVAPGTTDVARRWAWHLARAEALSHNPNIVSDLEHAGSGAWTDIAENVGMAASMDPGALFTAYMNSPPHRANILDPAARYLGVGVVERDGYAWNTLDFVNAYSSTYGRTRVPPPAMTYDTTTVTTTTDLASLERPDQRFGTARAGSIRASLMHFTGPTSGNDSGYAVLRRVNRHAGHGDVMFHDALDLTSASAVQLQLSVGDRLHRAVDVEVVLARSFGGSVSLGTVRVRPRRLWFTLALPAAARAYRTTLVLRVYAAPVSAAGGRVRLSVFDVRATA